MFIDCHENSSLASLNASFSWVCERLCEGFSNKHVQRFSRGFMRKDKIAKSVQLVDFWYGGII